MPPKSEEVGARLAGEAEVRRFVIAGFWRRLFAFLLDIAILAVPLYLLGIGSGDQAFSMGPWGRFIGYGIVLLYWGCLNSRLNKGQTVGKKVLKIAVVDKRGDYLSVGKAMLRALVLVLVGLLNNWAIPFSQNPIYAFISSAIVGGGSLAVLYGLIFNRKTHQGIHDLLTGSYVVKVIPEPGTVAPEIPLIHIRLSYAMLVLGLISAIVNSLLEVNRPTFGIIEPGEQKQIQEIQSALLQSGEFYGVSVTRTNTRIFGSPTVSKALTITLWVKKPCSLDMPYCEGVLMRSAQLAFDRFDQIDNLTNMNISLYNAFDFGLATGSRTWGNNSSIADWRKNLSE